MYYNFEELAELGIAIHALRRGMRPKEVADILIAQRNDIRQQCIEAVEVQPEAGLNQYRVKSHGKSLPIPGNERYPPKTRPFMKNGLDDTGMPALCM